ncbi:MAG TPA: hypothetical protein PLL30_03325 [Candidatus Krumholzibacteria bacterium]|nr:hypothetical protein [Candidatus Krumholzibacteria bacterium]HPD70804.1 hypothetical protein [Candidatus Krumholzibacteria bacterium]HRY39496.1 hypothetical protein [Candidatus Krumholzibacteria bacterium]
MNRISTTALILVGAFLAIAGVPAAQAQDEVVPVNFIWTGCPATDQDGHSCARAVRYQVFLQRASGEEALIAIVEGDTTYTLEAERGIVQRIRVVGVDHLGRLSVPSEWSDPVYFEPERSDGNPDGLPPAQPALLPNYPNPFNPETNIAYGVPADTPATIRMALEIYNLRGERIRTFAIDATPGWHEVTWNGLDDRGLPQSTGTYLTRYVCGDQVEVAKMTMVK